MNNKTINYYNKHTQSFINHLSMVNSKGKEMVAILQRIDLKNLFHTFLNYRSKKYGQQEMSEKDEVMNDG